MTQPALTMLTEDEQILRDFVRTFAEKELLPRVHKMDEEQKLDPELIKACFANGLMGIEVPEQYGGTASSIFSAIVTIEELAFIDPSVSVFVDVQNTLVNNAILRWGNDEIKEKYLPRLVTDTVASYALSEPASGSDAFALQARAEDKGDHYLLNGTKLWITNGGEASLFIVMANVDPSLGYKGITSFIVEKGTPGFTVGKKEDKLGIRASSTVELNFDDCEVPAANILGEVGVGYKIAIETLNEGRIGIGAQMIGLAQGAFDYAMNYMLERKQFGKPIASFQGLEFQYAQLSSIHNQKIATDLCIQLNVSHYFLIMDG